jgi:hypothetical protein
MKASCFVVALAFGVLFQVNGCSSSPSATDGGHAGTAGANGDGGMSCADLASQYRTALTAARSCVLNARGQCTQMVNADLSPCGSCQIFVNDATALNALKAQWLQAGCDRNESIPCALIACAQPRAGECVAGDGGGALCGPGPFGVE